MIEGIVLLFFAVVLLCFAIGFRQSGKKFKARCRITTAQVIGSRHSDNSTSTAPLVRFEHEGKTVDAAAQKVPDKYLPAMGAIVEIAYVKGSFAGLDTWEVRLTGPGGSDKNDRVIVRVLFGVTLILAIAGFALIGTALFL